MKDFSINTAKTNKETLDILDPHSNKILHLIPPSNPRLNPSPISILKPNIYNEIPKLVLRKKLSKQRHLVMPQGISPHYLNTLFPSIQKYFEPQTVHYNGGIANVTEWKLSCYLEVMEGGIPCTNPHIKLKAHCEELLDLCNDIFRHWYRQQHSMDGRYKKVLELPNVTRLMTFITRYTSAPKEQALLKHVDGAGKVDGSIVVALPTEPTKSFEGHGGGLTFWDGRDKSKTIHYDTRNGDIAFIDKAVWHQADPITKGTRWALVIFYKVLDW